MTTELDFVNFPDEGYVDLIEEQWFKQKNQHLKHIEHLNFFYIPDDSEGSREQLRSYISFISSTNAFANIVLVTSNLELAFIGWEQDVVAFYPTLSAETGKGMANLINRLLKFPPYQGAILKKLKIKSKGHFDLVDTKDICFCMGSGNWTEIYMADGTMRKECRPLGNLEERLSNVSSIKRVGKSLLVNRNRVLQITGNDVRFVTNQKAPPMKQRLGEKYIKELRKFVYWY
ncbi:LytTR family transcriptional regulator DNA-binding domain-containing protein [Muricauda sp. SCSIO 64092]|uniref:LytTR family transcriptional regulator DNA-binding domain-containing protein n=1 Tax=Allomuricauda sp. SCSIO 64092 TaxID=2908842 RepID=UPI001FF1A242|nr:LytTR family transcriptional regulator DNA-binding domain-containing protein [Muricauda sp. SCSIO 64092]UOY07968.1 LytTR family transcriptional regulator DNA-binding domain-containing protein [Muricauda sp. SCSIO 64092]